MGDESMGPEGPAPARAFADGERIRYCGRGEDRSGTVRDASDAWGLWIYFIRLDDRPDLLRPAEGYELRFLGRRESSYPRPDRGAGSSYP